MFTISGTERTTICFDTCYFLFVNIYASEYFLLRQHILHVSLGQTVTVILRKGQEAGPRTRKNGFHPVFAPGPRTLTVYNWGLHLRQLSQDEVLLLSSSGCKRLCKLQWNMVVIHQLMDVDYEVSPSLKWRVRAMLLTWSLERKGRVRFRDKWVLKTFEINSVCACVCVYYWSKPGEVQNPQDAVHVERMA